MKLWARPMAKCHFYMKKSFAQSLIFFGEPSKLFCNPSTFSYCKKERLCSTQTAPTHLLHPAWGCTKSAICQWPAGISGRRIPRNELARKGKSSKQRPASKQARNDFWTCCMLRPRHREKVKLLESCLAMLMAMSNINMTTGEGVTSATADLAAAGLSKFKLRPL